MAIRVSRDVGVLLAGSGLFALAGFAMGRQFIFGLCITCFALTALEVVARRGRSDD